jgi:K+-sensing histidine kinase KdpD
VSAALNSAIEKATAFAESRNVALPPPPVGLGLAHGEEELLIKALQALLETAVKFSARGGTVSLTSAAFPGSLIVIIDSHGKTIPSGDLGRFFDLFSIAEASTPGVDLGLGAAVAQRILSLFGATACVANLDPPGIQLTVSLKRLSSMDDDRSLGVTPHQSHLVAMTRGPSLDLDLSLLTPSVSCRQSTGSPRERHLSGRVNRIVRLGMIASLPQRG